MKNYLILSLIVVAFLSCEKTDIKSNKTVDANAFYKINEPQNNALSIDGDGDIDIIVSGFAPKDDIDGDGDIDIIVSGLAASPDIDGDTDIDIIISGLSTVDPDDLGGGDGKGNFQITGKTKVEIIKNLGDFKFDAKKNVASVGLKIPKNAFFTSTNTPVTGKVDLELKILSTKTDFIFSGLDDRLDDDKWMSSFVKLYLKATQGGKELKLNPAIPGIQAELFLNPNLKKVSKEGDASVATLRSKFWSLTKLPVTRNVDRNSYSFLINDLGWFSIGKQEFTDRPLITTQVKFTDSETIKNAKEVKLWYVWSDKNIVMRLDATKSGNQWTVRPVKIPVNEKPKLLILATGLYGGQNSTFENPLYKGKEKN